jgi:predicted Rossmann-fold nucleotide-binding protein
MRGFRALHFVGPCVTVFGSARFSESHPYYEMARQCGAGLAGAGFTVMTGGGPGIMEAANRGAKEAGGRSIGCSIELPEEQKPIVISTAGLLFATSLSGKSCWSNILMLSSLCPADLVLWMRYLKPRL